MQNSSKIDKYRQNIIKWATKIEAYKANSNQTSANKKALEIGLHSAILLYDSACLMAETQPLIDKITCQNLISPIPQQKKHTTNSPHA